MPDNDDFPPSPFVPGEEREPDETDRSLEPILVKLCKLVAFEIRDQTPIAASVVSIDVGYQMNGDADETERHVRIVFSPGDDFEDKFMQFAAERLLNDAKKIINGEETDDPDDETGG